MNSAPDQKWRIGVSKDPLSTKEREAYALMQKTITSKNNAESSKALLDYERAANDLDFMTSEGRRRRSKKNLTYLAEIHHDCPPSLLCEFTNTMMKKRCTLEHAIWDIDSSLDEIIRSGALFSNEELDRQKIHTRGGTDSSVVDDRKEFGNHDFVFTRPIFHDANQSIKIGRDRFYIPADEQLLDHFSWLSFKDWASMDQDKYLHNKQSGDEPKDKQLHSIYYDFFVGKKDIAQAISYKVFEAVKTAMILYADENEDCGFNLQNAQQFLNDVKGFPARTGYVQNANTLEKPINYYVLSEKQKAFLLDDKKPERNAIISQAFEGILNVLGKEGELKVPVALSLNGATIGDRYLATDTSQPISRRFCRRKEGQWIDVDPESFEKTPISPRLPFERRIGGFECPD